MEIYKSIKLWVKMKKYKVKTSYGENVEGKKVRLI